jgi:CIC family chloride channel protein
MTALSELKQKAEHAIGDLSRTRQPVVWAVALLIGIIVAYAAIAFRLAIRSFQYLSFGANTESLAASTLSLPWWQLLLAPTLGGVAVGVFLQFVMERPRPFGVADVIDARALHGARLPLRKSIESAAVTAASLGFGASAGREGPAAHLGAALASYFALRFEYDPVIARTLMACGVAAAVSASFNAPLAGVLFALEVVLGHYALRAFGPIVISSIAAAVISRIHLGDFPAFTIPEISLMTYWEMPAFAVLGVVSAIVAIAFMRTVMVTEEIAAKIECPLWLRPASGGFLIGAIAILFPQVLGVGYGATDDALNELYPLGLLVALILAKGIATSITLASRFGGGVFSPSLYLGAMTGGAFGIIAATIFPDQATSHGLYALVGMGAVSAAVLGAPISTTLIVFELTGEWQISLALLVAVSISTVMTQSILGRSFFHWQLERRGLRIRDGAHQYILKTIKVRDIMRVYSKGAAPPTPHDHVLLADDSLESALKMLESEGLDQIPVKAKQEADDLIGVVDHKTALKAYNQALIDTQVEEHR